MVPKARAGILLSFARRWRTGVVDFDIVEVLVVVEIIEAWSHVGGCVWIGGRGCRYSISMCKKVQARAESRARSVYPDDFVLPVLRR